MRPKKLDYSADCCMFDKYIDTIDQEHSSNLHCYLPYRFFMDTDRHEINWDIFM